MPSFSVFTSFGLLSFSGAPSDAETIYQSMLAGKVRAYSMAEKTHQEGKTYAQAMAIARAKATLKRGQNQNFDPYNTIELLPEKEKDWGLIPPADASIYDRQHALAERMLQTRGAVREAMESNLKKIFGESFIELRTMEPSDVVYDNTFGNFADPSIAFKLVRILTPVGYLGSGPSWAATENELTYENADPTQAKITLQKGDKLVVQPDSYSLREIVEVISATDTTFRALFTKPHDADCLATTQNWVGWTSTQCSYYVIVTPEAAMDAELVREANEYLTRAAKGVFQWFIVYPENDQVGPFTLNVSKLGGVSVGVIPVEGGVVVTPTYIMTEQGDNLTTEPGDLFITES